jgi:hypothetical protein
MCVVSSLPDDSRNASTRRILGPASSRGLLLLLGGLARGAGLDRDAVGSGRRVDVSAAERTDGATLPPARRHQYPTSTRAPCSSHRRGRLRPAAAPVTEDRKRILRACDNPNPDASPRSRGLPVAASRPAPAGPSRSRRCASCREASNRARRALRRPRAGKVTFDAGGGRVRRPRFRERLRRRLELPASPCGAALTVERSAVGPSRRLRPPQRECRDAPGGRSQSSRPPVAPGAST